MDEIINQVHRRMQGQFVSSRNKLAGKGGDGLFSGRAKEFGLVEHYYEEGAEDEHVRDTWERVKASLSAFSTNTDFRRQLQKADARGSSSRVFVEEPDLIDFEEMRFRSTQIGNFDIYACPDLILELSDGTLQIIDWKTGALPRDRDTHEITHQLVLYSLWATNRWPGIGLDHSKIEAQEYYLPGGEIYGRDVREDDRADVIQFVRASVVRIREHLDDPDLNSATEDRFPGRGSIRKCAICEYRGVCPCRTMPT